jgi:deoxyribodipyrimidine photo-lyase
MPASLVWFRRDLRLADHAALYQALRDGGPVWCVFVFDRDILDLLPSPQDRRVAFIHAALSELTQALQAKGGGLIVRHGSARSIIPQLAAELDAESVFINHDYEPAALERDAAVERSLQQQGRRLLSFKDQVIFERSEVLTGQGKPYSVFTPYKKAWLAKLEAFYLKPYPVERYLHALAPFDHHWHQPLPALAALGFEPSDLQQIGYRTGVSGAEHLLQDFLARIDSYRLQRDFPAVKGPSYLSPHLRFGTLSIRRVAALALERTRGADSEGAATWLSELIWREFYAQILHHHPHVVGHAFRPEYDRLQFEDRPQWLQAWKQGMTGYPLVDAAMRQLSSTGYMHNRLRMVTASFLVKDLQIDWRHGEQHFADLLIDFDLSSNNGGWQWAASTGCDAQPWFRIFNPVTQSERFDPQGRFIRRYVPELNAVPLRWLHAPWQMPALEQQALHVSIGKDYPLPLIAHDQARAQTLERYGRIKAKAEI